MNTWPPLRAAALLVALGAAAWLLAQGCTLLWVAAEAQATASATARGMPLHRWALGDRAAVVAPGSEGLAAARWHPNGLQLAGDVPVVDLSLALHGRPLAAHRYRAAMLQLDSSTPLRARLLLGTGDGAMHATEWVTVDGGDAGVRLPLGAMEAPSRELRLRLERDAPGRLVLQALALVEPRCGGQDLPPPADCPGSAALALAARASPEAFLRARDRLLHAAPAVLVTAAAVPAGLAAAVAGLQSARWLPPLALVLSLLVLGWALLARWRGQDRGAAWQLLPLLAVPVLLLALGFPRADEGLVVTLALLASIAAALLHPGGRRDWRWLGGPAAWRAAAWTALAGAVLVAAVAVAGWAGSALAPDWRPGRIPRYLAWALLQQALLLVAITPRLARAVRDPALAAVLAGGVFALLHLPNFGLMLATLLAGSAWAWLGRRHGALLPLAVAHALLGTLLLWAGSPWLLRSAEVGGRFLMP